MGCVVGMGVGLYLLGCGLFYCVGFGVVGVVGVGG